MQDRDIMKSGPNVVNWPVSYNNYSFTIKTEQCEPSLPLRALPVCLDESKNLKQKNAPLNNHSIAWRR